MSVDIDKLTKPFPREAIKSRQGGGKRMYDYVPTHLVIRRLNDATGYNWDWRIVKLERHGDLLMCYGELTIPGHGTRTGIGVQQVSPGGGEDLAKGVSSDALKKAATLFGVALELYGPDVEGDGEIDAPQPMQRQQPARTYPHEVHYAGKPQTAANTFLATEDQILRLSAAAKRIGWDKDELLAYMVEVHGPGWTKRITIEQADQSIAHLVSMQPPATVAQPALT